MNQVLGCFKEMDLHTLIDRLCKLLWYCKIMSNSTLFKVVVWQKYYVLHMLMKPMQKLMWIVDM